MARREHIELLLGKAAQDEHTLDILLRDGGAPAESVGFHAQQAAEKLLKAAIKAGGADYPLTHDLHRLMRLAAQAGDPVPESLRAIRTLTPFAGEYRYDALPAEGSANLRGSEVRELLRELRAWVEALVESRYPAEEGECG